MPSRRASLAPWPVTSRERAVPALAAAVRLAVVAAMLLSDALLPDYDSSVRLTDFQCSSDTSPPSGRYLAGTSAYSLAAAAKRLAVWDSVFFLRVAKCGYEYEHFHAFFPLLPGLIRLCQTAAPFAGGAELCGLLLSNGASVASAVYFHRLTAAVFGDDRLTTVSTLLFIFNPASVFLSAVYTESLFVMLVFAGMYYGYRGRLLLATAAFALASATRSNGILSCWFVIHPALAHLLIANRSDRGLFKANVMAKALGSAVASCCLILAPFIAFQWYGYHTFCPGRDSHSTLSTHSVPSSQQQPSLPWCQARLPYLYGYIQDKYWGVGFLKYYQLKQVPNFLLAAPVLCLSAVGCWSYFAHDWRRAFTLGLSHSLQGQQDSAARQQAGQHGILSGTCSRQPAWQCAEHNATPADPDSQAAKRGQDKGGSQPRRPSTGATQRRQAGSLWSAKHAQRATGQPQQQQQQQDQISRRAASPYSADGVAVYVYHWALIAAVAALMMHVQVSTRFLSCCPPLYWYAAYLYVERRQSWVWAFCLAYMGLGIVLFPNFYPWT